ncbi:MAG TPA: PhzF family phenazine biosynthesis protein [Ilumatobacteraceae bacterium]|nr:PhzF family phenazine biosynthesis protein [Ilumatobacteraceae bacterium]
MQRRFTQVDVFSSQPYLGNPLAVVVDADGLDTQDMQRFAKWTNLSETTFLLPPTDPGADYRVRIFTPASELPFAGHPTLGSAHAWLAHGGVPQHDDQVVQQCGVGLVTVRRGVDGLAFGAPALLKGGPADEATVREAADSLRVARDAIIAAEWVDNGPGWLGLLFRSAEEVLAIKPGPMQLSIGVAGPHAPGSPFAYEVRAFYSANGTTFEDPVTGSLNASLAQWLIGSGRFTAPYLAVQGTAIGYSGLVRITTDESGDVWVGGDVTTCIAGTVEL